MLSKVPKHRLRVGLVLPCDLCDARGRVLLRRGVRLTSSDVALLKKRGSRDFYTRGEWTDGPTLDVLSELDANGGPGTLSVDQLHDGLVLPRAIYDSGNVLLLAAGTKITQRFLQLLRRRNIWTVRLGAAERETTVSGGQLEHAVAVDESLRSELDRPFAVRHISNVERPRLPPGVLGEAVHEGLERHAATRNLVHDVCARAVSGESASAAVVREAVDEFAKMMIRDFDVAPLVVSLQKSKSDYLFDHCVNTSLTSMSICAQLGWKRDQVAEVGLGTMLQDIGMLRVPESIRLARRRLTSAEWRQIEIHPYHALEQLERIADLPEAVKFIAYQSHERGDRSGYPKHRSNMYLHPYAKIVAIADTYAAMTHARPYRPAMLPYHAAKTILVESSTEKYDRTFVRAFLDAVSLFPIGSCVALNDGRRGRVIRANPGYHTRPVIEDMAADGDAAAWTLDLSKEERIRIIDVVSEATADAATPAFAV